MNPPAAKRHRPLTIDRSRHIEVTLPRCLACHSADLIVVRTEYRDRQTGESCTRRQCRACGSNWLVTAR